MDKLTEEQMIEILSDKMDSLRCLSCSKYFPDPCEDCSFVEVFNDVVDFVSSLLQKEREAGKREGIEMLEGAKFPYEHYWPRAKQEQRLCETCNEVVERYTPCKASKHYPCWQAFNSVIEKLKSVEKSNSLQEKLEIDDFKFDKKGNSIP